MRRCADFGGGTGGTPPTDTPFVPEGIELNYVGQGDSGGLEIIAFTLLQSDLSE